MKRGSRKIRGGGITDLLSAASAGTPFDLSKMNDVVKAVGAVSDSLKNAPALIQSAQDQIKTDVKGLVNKQVAAATADITAKAVDAATQAVGSLPPGVVPPALNPAGLKGSNNAPANNSGNAPANNSGNAPANNSSNAPANNSGNAPANNSGNAPANNSGNAPANNSGNAPANNSENVPENNSSENVPENNSSNENFEGGGSKKCNTPCKCVCKCQKKKTRRRRRGSKVKRRHTRRR